MLDWPILGILLVAAFVHGAFGFGFPLVATPLLALQMDLRAAILLTLAPTICINLVSILGERERAEAWRRFWPIPVGTLCGALLGTRVLLSLDPEPLRLLLALVLLGYLLADRLQGVDRVREVPRWGLALLGLALGLLAGLVNIFAPVLILFALYTRMPTGLMVATFNFSFITSKAGQLLGFAINDAIDPVLLGRAAMAVPLVLLLLWLGILVRRRIQPSQYRRGLRLALWVMAIALLWDSLSILFGVPQTALGPADGP